MSRTDERDLPDERAGDCYAGGTPPQARPSAVASARAARAEGPPYADCVLCGEPTEYGAGQPGATLCPVCEWQEAQRSACSG